MLSVILAKKSGRPLQILCTEFEGPKVFFSKIDILKKENSKVAGYWNLCKCWCYHVEFKMIATEDGIGSYGIIGFFHQRVQKWEWFTSVPGKYRHFFPMFVNKEPSTNIHQQPTYTLFQFAKPVVICGFSLLFIWSCNVNLHSFLSFFVVLHWLTIMRAKLAMFPYYTK